MEETEVVNIRNTSLPYVYIGRPGYFGNPFVIGPDGTRAEVLDKYGTYFDVRMTEDIEFFDRIMGLRGKRLGCFCKPEPCHGDIIKRYLDWIDLSEREQAKGT